jgi:hypothetical protein
MLFDNIVIIDLYWSHRMGIRYHPSYENGPVVMLVSAVGYYHLREHVLLFDMIVISLQGICILVLSKLFVTQLPY